MESDKSDSDESGCEIDLTGILFGNIDANGKLVEDGYDEHFSKENLGSLAK